jgi:hypothetical protein
MAPDGYGVTGTSGQVSPVSGPVVAEDPRHLDRLVAWRPPQFLATRRVAGNLEVTATSLLGSLAVARFPADSYRAGQPRMMAAALLRESRPSRWLLLYHAYIQTHYRSRSEARWARIHVLWIRQSVVAE